MEVAGLIKDNADLKILILYVLDRLPAPVDPESLYDICLCDNGVGYFDYIDCLTELVSSGHVEETDDEFSITDKGRRNSATLSSSIPYSVRNAAERAMTPVIEKLKRYSMITSEYTQTPEGGVIHLAMSDGISNIIDMSLFCGSDEQAKVMKKNFRRNAEEIYHSIYMLLSEEKKRNRK